MPRNTLYGGEERPKTVAGLGGAPVPPSTPEEREKLPKDTLFEVMIDTFGYEPQFIRGDLITPKDAPDYDLLWAEQVGSVRRAPEYVPRHAEAAARPASAHSVAASTRAE
jgi:hypothetical protein